MLLVALGGCAHHAPAAHQAPPTPIARLNTAAMAIPRIDFCSLVPATAVHDALATSRWRLTTYRNGQKAPVGTATSGGTDDVIAEHDCVYTARRGVATARAWVFATPVHQPLARQVIAQAGREPGCSLVKGPAFGSPSLTQVCTSAGTVRVRVAGLFGTTWLSCEASDATARDVVRRRADAWCVQIANTLDTNR